MAACWNMSHYIKNNRTCNLFPDQTSIKTTVTISALGTCEKIDNLVPPRPLSITETSVKTKPNSISKCTQCRAFCGTEGLDQPNQSWKMGANQHPCKKHRSQEAKKIIQTLMPSSKIFLMTVWNGLMETLPCVEGGGRAKWIGSTMIKARN